MSVETTQVSAELINTAFVNKIESGHIKEAEEAASAYIRTQLYEEGVLRRLFDSRTVTADELDPNEDDDKPSILCEIEPDAPSATFVPFKGTGDRRYFEGNRFRVPFGKIESTRENKSKFELMSIRMDIMSWLKDKHVRKIQGEEDDYFMQSVEDILAGNTASQVVDGSVAANFKDAFTYGLKGLSSLKLPVGKILMHRNTYLDSLQLKVEEIGDGAQARRFEQGIDGEDSFLGYPVVTTIKDEICPENKMYFFAPQDYFVKFMFLQDATLFLKSEADMLQFHTYEAPGMGIGNTRGVLRVDL